MRTLVATGASPALIASVSGQITGWVAHHGAYAVFGLMAVDALLPAGGELIMLYAGALGAGAIAGQHATLFGAHLSTGIESYLALAVIGALGYLAGSLIGWVIGVRGGRPLIERHGRWLHLNPQAFRRAERWFERFGHQAVFFGRLTPVVRSFIDPRRCARQPPGPLRRTDARRLADLVPGVRRRRLGPRRHLELVSPRLPLRRLHRPRRHRAPRSRGPLAPTARRTADSRCSELIRGRRVIAGTDRGLARAGKPASKPESTAWLSGFCPVRGQG
jgi:membrane protein YqaA with SNARE-associated domain